MQRLRNEFFTKSAIEAAPAMLGKTLVHRLPGGDVRRLVITEVEAYFGEEDSACHARAGRTPRTEMLYREGGVAYVYLCYGIHYLFNVVTGPAGHPEAVLLRGGLLQTVPGGPYLPCIGPGRLTKALEIAKQHHGEDLRTSEQIWLEGDDCGETPPYKTTPRIGIDYAKEPYKSILWRFLL